VGVALGVCVLSSTPGVFVGLRKHFLSLTEASHGQQSKEQLVSSAAVKCSFGLEAKRGSVKQTVIEQHGEKDDEWLMREIQKGNRDALGELFQRHWLRLLKIASRVLQSNSEAEELVQELFIYVWNRAQNFDPRKSPPKFWLSRVAYSRALDRRDYLKARRFYDSVDGADLFERIPLNRSLEEEVAASELRKLLAREITELNRGQQFTLQLFFFEGYTLAEISEYLGEPIGNIRHHYYRGLERLRRKFKQKTGENSFRCRCAN
jgi:RNA polymerase sigma-70 factor, ECF subfamily